MPDEKVRPIYEGYPSRTARVSPVEFVAPIEGKELEFSNEFPNLAAFLRATAAMVPFGSFAFPSYREDFQAMSQVQKALELGFDFLPLVPPAIIGKGLQIAAKVGISYPAKAVAKGVAFGVKKSPFAMRSVEAQSIQFLDRLSQKVGQFVYEEPLTRLAKDYGVTIKEAEAVFNGKTFTWEPIGRSGAYMPVDLPGKARFFKSDGSLKKEVANKIEKYSLSREVQARNFAESEWRKLVAPIISSAKNLGAEPGVRLGNIFKAQTTRVFGPEAASQFSISTLGETDFRTLIYDTLLNRGKILRNTDASIKSYLLPVRKVFGPFEDLYNSFSGIYQPLKESLELSRKSAYESITNFQMQLATKKINGVPLGSMTQRATGELVWHPNFAKEVWEEAGMLVRNIDDLARRGERTPAMQALMDQSSQQAQAIAKTYWEWTDQMYVNHFKEKVSQIFHSRGLTPEGTIGFEILTQGKGGLFKQLDGFFSASANIPYEEKLLKAQNVLQQLRKSVQENPNWFKVTQIAGGNKKFLDAFFDKLTKDLTMRSGKQKDGFLNYLEGYATRVPEKFGGQEFAPRPGGQMRKAAYTKPRYREVSLEATNDLAKMVEARSTMQGKELYLYPKLPEIYRAAEIFPERLKNFTDHYLARIMGEPSPMDDKVAVWINKTLGTQWDGRRVMEMAWKVNDLIYMGGIGFKPFSALRNYFQPLLLVPGDLGGVKDVYWITRGYGRLFDPTTRAYVREIGAIAEYAPDLLIKPEVSGFGKKFLGIQAPPLAAVRDAAMWMFRNSDMHNRYITGGAAMAKWEHFAKRFDLTTSSGLDKFRRAINVGGREKVVQAEMNKFFALGTKEGLEEAKKIFVRDVIEDTQFLYGIADSPLASHVGGAVTKTGLVFQTWWMNYGSLLGKWMSRSGTIEEGVERMFSGMFSAAIAYNLMEPIWGKRTALSSIGTGPFPIGLTVPPSWVPFYEGLKTVKAATEIPFDAEKGINGVKKQIVATLKSLPIFFPAGLQLRGMVEGGVKSGPQGILDSIIRYHRQ